MKKKKLYYLLLILVLTFTPNVVYAEKYIVCNGDSRFPYSIMAVVALLVQLFKIIVPIILILMGSITFAKAVLSSDIDKNLKQAVTVFIRKCISAIAVFFVVVIVSAVINMLPDNEDSKNCIKCAIDPGDCQTVEVDESYKKPEIPQGSGDGTETTVTNQVLYSSSTSTTTGSGVMNVVNTQPVQNTDSNAGTVVENGYAYKLYVPQYVASSKPLIVYLPGMNGGGATSMYNAVKNSNYNAYILIFSQSTSADSIVSTIRTVVNMRGIDSSKVSVWGYSLGAMRIIDIIKGQKYSFKNAAIISIGENNYIADNNNFSKQPMLVIRGKGDNDWGNSTTSFYNNIKHHGNIDYKEYSCNGHGDLINPVIGDLDTLVNWSLTH